MKPIAVVGCEAAGWGHSGAWSRCGGGILEILLTGQNWLGNTLTSPLPSLVALDEKAGHKEEQEKREGEGEGALKPEQGRLKVEVVKLRKSVKRRQR